MKPRFLSFDCRALGFMFQFFLNFLLIFRAIFVHGKENQHIFRIVFQRKSCIIKETISTMVDDME
jgi:hypothetical protein